MKTILFSCGDRSADRYLSELLKYITQINPNIKKIVLGGELSKKYSDVFIEDLVSYDAHGFFSPFILFKDLYRIYDKLKNLFKEQKINLVVLIDFYGFNIKLARIAKQYCIPVVYYIAPQVWATRFYRIKKIKKYVDQVFTIFPFETKIYKKYGINTEYVGHPIIDILDIPVLVEKNLSNDKYIGLFPGSRLQVIRWNLPVMLDISKFYLTNYDKKVKFILFGFKNYEYWYKRIIFSKLLDNKIEICYDNRYRDKLMFAISTSGSVVLEHVLYKTPCIVVYKLPELMYFLIKTLILVKYISLPNIILCKEIVPEFIQRNINIKKICEYIHETLINPEKYNDIVQRYTEFSNSLFPKDNQPVSKIVAEKIIKLL